MNNLKRSLLGKYNADDVDKLLKTVRNDYEECLKSQKERIFKLREENRDLTEALDAYKSSEQYIINTLTQAEQTAQAIIAQASYEAKRRLEQAHHEAQQIKMTADACYQRLFELKGASDTIQRAVSNVLGDDPEPNNGNIRQFAGYHDTLRY